MFVYISLHLFIFVHRHSSLFIVPLRVRARVMKLESTQETQSNLAENYYVRKNFTHMRGNKLIHTFM
jgi:hypothetical protein